MIKKEYRWLHSSGDASIIEQLTREINIPESLASVLMNRGITSYAQAREFFRPKIEDLHDPFLMDGMEAAVQRILKAVEKKERVLVFGDYDVDGTNAASMMTLFLRELGLETTYHIPDRIVEGYGISKLGIDKAAQQSVTLMIAVDCGITAIQQVEYAGSLGIEVIICDHHEPIEQIPNAVAVLDPLKPSCQYPFKHLCGAGVAFKVIQAICKRRGNENAAFSYLDFVTLATAADIVPLVGENRILTKIGLTQLNENPRIGIRALIESSGTQLGKINTGQIVFVLAPRINAVGRMGDATRAVNLLTSTNAAEAIQIARVLEEENRNRRKLDEDTFLQAQTLAEQIHNVNQDPVIVLHHNEWHPGVIGIVASRLVEKYYRPTIMLTTVDGFAKGSARSIVGFDIYRALKKVEDKLVQFGGHKYAAGLIVALDRVDEFRKAFTEAVNELLPEEIRTPEIRIDSNIALTDITPRFLKILKEFAPFGPGNMRPIFHTSKVNLAGEPRIVGNEHLRFRVKQDKHVFDTIGFGLGSKMESVKRNGSGLDIVFSVDEYEKVIPGSDSTMVETFPQLKIKDLKINHEVS
ncbi:MAG: single-stranded-DNA-specific exonuclease RecJ [Ignavibacteriae bacterium]|nr:single-stranded-DNA-specific exonuclease RecJ [Ignavibacteriota bacterium]